MDITPGECSRRELSRIPHIFQHGLTMWMSRGNLCFRNQHGFSFVLVVYSKEAVRKIASHGIMTNDD
jgi:hypothetical protein